MKQEIQYKEEDEIIYIKAAGHITANNCYILRKRIFNRLDKDPPVKEIYADLADCSYMDSTFIGILIGINKKFKSSYGKKINIVCPSTECCKLFEGLGITKLLHLEDTSVDLPLNMEIISHHQKPSTTMLLDAHEDLMETSDENKNKFKLLKEILEKKLNQEK
ncbi:MAG: STAS domain-containing protein [Spirochaetales bacterium]|nr:STAS domain-containing protein [Spirochaetales bacterium]